MTATWDDAVDTLILSNWLLMPWALRTRSRVSIVGIPVLPGVDIASPIPLSRSEQPQWPKPTFLGVSKQRLQTFKAAVNLAMHFIYD